MCDVRRVLKGKEDLPTSEHQVRSTYLCWHGNSCDLFFVLFCRGITHGLDW